jgi:hypothetical protein
MGKSLAVKEESALEPDSSFARVVESLVLKGDISMLGPQDRAQYYVDSCRQLGLNPATQPLAILKLNGREILYPTRGATDQLAAIHKLTREIIDGPRVIDLGGIKLVYCVCRATHPNGRTETAVATVPLTDPVNVLMKCETKGKRRATLSILGLGMLDESELETIPERLKEQAPPIDLGVLEQREAPAEEAPAKTETPAPTVVPTKSEARLELEASLGHARTLNEVAQCWVAHRAKFEENGPAKQSAWSECITVAATVLKSENRRAVNLALAAEVRRFDEPDPSPDRSTGEHRAAPVDSEAAAEREAIQAEGQTSARAWIEKTLAGHHEAITHLVRSWLAHRSDFGAEHEAAQLVFVRVARESFGYGPQALERFVRDEAKRQQEQMQAARRGKLQLVRRAA